MLVHSGLCKVSAGLELQLRSNCKFRVDSQSLGFFWAEPSFDGPLCVGVLGVASFKLFGNAWE